MIKIKEFFNEEEKRFITRESQVPFVYGIMDPKTLIDRGIISPILNEVRSLLPENAIIAGGSVLSLISEKPIKDVDVFFFNEEAMVNMIENLKKAGYQMRPYKENFRFLNFYKGDIEVQLINTLWYSDAAAVIKSFDFTISQFALLKDGTIIYNQNSLLDLYKNRLVLYKLQFPVSTLRRLIKYTSKGFYACNGCLKSILDAANGLNTDERLAFINQVFYID